VFGSAFILKKVRRRIMKKVHKVEDILNNWRNKRYTLIGKITVIKALAAS